MVCSFIAVVSPRVHMIWVRVGSHLIPWLSSTVLRWQGLRNAFIIHAWRSWRVRARVYSARAQRCWSNKSCIHGDNIFCCGPFCRDWGDPRRLVGSAGDLHCLTMTAENPEPGDLALAPLLTCKLCLCEQSLDKMTTLQECQCVFCTAVSSLWCSHHEKYEGRSRRSAGCISAAHWEARCAHVILSGEQPYIWICIPAVSWLVSLIFVHC